MLCLTVNKFWLPSIAITMLFSCGKIEQDGRDAESNTQLNQLRLDSGPTQMFLPAQDNGCDNDAIDFAPTGRRSFGYINDRNTTVFKFWAPIKNIKFDFKTCWSPGFSVANDRPRLRVFSSFDPVYGPSFESLGPNIAVNAVGSHGLDQGNISNRANVRVELSTTIPDMIVDNLSAELFDTPHLTLKINAPGQVKFEKGIGSSLTVETRDGVVTPAPQIKSFSGVWQGFLCNTTQTNKCFKVIVDMSQARQDVQGKFTANQTGVDSSDNGLTISGTIAGTVKGNVLFGSLVISSELCDSRQIGFKLSEASELRESFFSLDEKITCSGSEMSITAFKRQ